MELAGIWWNSHLSFPHGISDWGHLNWKSFFEFTEFKAIPAMLVIPFQYPSSYFIYYYHLFDMYVIRTR